MMDYFNYRFDYVWKLFAACEINLSLGFVWNPIELCNNCIIVHHYNPSICLCCTEAPVVAMTTSVAHAVAPGGRNNPPDLIADGPPKPAPRKVSLHLR